MTHNETKTTEPESTSKSENCENMKNVLDQLLRENTDHNQIEDMDEFETIEIGEDSPFMTLTISKQTSRDIRVSHYINGNPRRPDPMIRFDNSEKGFKPVNIEQMSPTGGKTFHENTRKIRNFVENTWANNLENQHAETQKTEVKA